MNETFNRATIEALVGTMYSGKTEELASRIKRAKELGQCVVYTFRPIVDTRKQRQVATDQVKRAWDIIKKIDFLDERIMVVIDEAQFIDQTVLYAVQILKMRGCNVIVAGLDKDFRGQPFGYMPHLMALSDKKINHLEKAVCYKHGCLEVATLPQRLKDGKPDSALSPTVIIEGSDSSYTYHPVCQKHHEVPGLELYLLKQKEMFCDD